tara:strand:- start:3252 stop:3536 length:285 start_codon:yes stop_codon:yes gene_type:complete
MNMKSQIKNDIYQKMERILYEAQLVGSYQGDRDPKTRQRKMSKIYKRKKGGHTVVTHKEDIKGQRTDAVRRRVDNLNQGHRYAIGVVSHKRPNK